MSPISPALSSLTRFLLRAYNYLRAMGPQLQNLGMASAIAASVHTRTENGARVSFLFFPLRSATVIFPLPLAPTPPPSGPHDGLFWERSASWRASHPPQQKTDEDYRVAARHAAQRVAGIARAGPHEFRYYRRPLPLSLPLPFPLQTVSRVGENVTRGRRTLGKDVARTRGSPTPPPQQQPACKRNETLTRRPRNHTALYTFIVVFFSTIFNLLGARYSQ